MVLDNETLKKLVVGSGFVPELDFDDAVKTSLELEQNPIDILIFRGLINEETISKLISDH